MPLVFWFAWFKIFWFEKCGERKPGQFSLIAALFIQLRKQLQYGFERVKELQIIFLLRAAVQVASLVVSLTCTFGNLLSGASPCPELDSGSVQGFLPPSYFDRRYRN